MVAAGVFVAGVLVGADSMSRAVGVPTYIADVIVAASLLAVLVATLLAQYRRALAQAAMHGDARSTSSPTPPFWVAVLRIATPLILGTLGVLLCERAGVLNLGIEGIMVAGAFAGWLAVYRGRAAVGRRRRWRRSPARRSACCTRLLTVGLALSQHVSGLGHHAARDRAELLRLPRELSRRSNTPPTITPFAPMDWLPIPVLDAQTPLTLLALLLVPLIGLAAVPHAGSAWRCAWSARTRRRPKARACRSRPCAPARSSPARR